MDDEAFNIVVLEKHLEGSGFSCKSCYNGKQCIEVIKEAAKNKQKFRMIFLDLNMPIMDGYECAEELKRFFIQNPVYKCPVIACSANSIDDDLKNDIGFDGFCLKPVNKQELKEIFNRFSI